METASPACLPLDEARPAYDPWPQMVQLGRLLRLQRKRHHYTQEWVATQIGVTRKHLREFEHGRIDGKLSMLLRLCALYDLHGWSLLPPPAGTADAALFAILPQLSDAEKWATVTVLGASVPPASFLCAEA